MSSAALAGETTEDNFEDDINETNVFIATKWDQLNRTVDMFFTNQKSPEKNKSSVFVYTSVYKKEGRPIETTYDFKFRIDLPNTTKKLKIIIEKQQDEITNALSDSSVSSNKSVNSKGKVVNDTQTHYTAGANFMLKQTKYFASFIDLGIRLDMPLNPFAKLDLQKTFKPNWVDLSLSQKWLYYRQEGFQSISQATFTKKWNKAFQNDFVNSLVWTDESDELILRHNLLLTHNLGKEKALTYSVGANAKFRDTYHYYSYDTSISYRQLIYNDWLYATWTAGIDFPKDDNFNDQKFVQFRLDIFFKEKLAKNQ